MTTTTDSAFRAVTVSGEGGEATQPAPVSTTVSGDDTTQDDLRRPRAPGVPALLPAVHVVTSETRKPSRPDVEAGKVLGRYRLDAVIGTGAFSTVFRAHDLSLDLPVVVKVLADDASPAAIERFRREIVFSRRVAHPGFSRIFELHEDSTPWGPLRYLTMEPVFGRTLGDLMNEGPVPPTRALTIARDLCAIVAAAHDQGVVHGDLKPSNVMLRSGARPRAMTDRFTEPKDDLVILDFGAATADDVKDPGVRVGSVRYMAPELFSPDARASRPSPQTDVWALGVLTYACLTGRYPYDGKSDQDVVDAVRRGAISPPSAVRGVPDAVDDAVLRALRMDRAERYPDCRAMKRALDDTLAALKRPSLWARLRGALSRRS